MFSRPVIDPTTYVAALDPFGTFVFVACFAVVAAITRLRPAYGIVALVAFVPFSFAHEIAGTTITLGKIALLATILGLVLRRAGNDGLRGPAARILLAAGLAVTLATALSITQATYRGAAIRETLKALEYVVLFATVVVAARADLALRGVATSIVATIVTVCCLALSEEITGAPSGLYFHEHPIPRIAGPLEGPNQLAGYLGIALCFALASLGNWPRQLAARIAIPLGIATEILTISRLVLWRSSWASQRSSISRRDARTHAIISSPAGHSSSEPGSWQPGVSERPTRSQADSRSRAISRPSPSRKMPAASVRARNSGTPRSSCGARIRSWESAPVTSNASSGSSVFRNYIRTQTVSTSRPSSKAEFPSSSQRSRLRARPSSSSRAVRSPIRSCSHAWARASVSRSIKVPTFSSSIRRSARCGGFCSRSARRAAMAPFAIAPFAIALLS